MVGRDDPNLWELPRQLHSAEVIVVTAEESDAEPIAVRQTGARPYVP